MTKTKKERARKLRAAGESIKVIADKIGRAPSTVHLWVKDITLDPVVQKRLNLRGNRASTKKEHHKKRDCGLKAQTQPVRKGIYNPKEIGDKSEAMTLAEFVYQGRTVLQPFGDKERYDLVVDEDGDFIRIQCKTARLTGKNSFHFSTESVNWNTKTSRDYNGQADVFAVFLRETRKIYIFNVSNLPKRACNVRLSKDDAGYNAQRFAEDHLLIEGKSLRTY